MTKGQTTERYTVNCSSLRWGREITNGRNDTCWAAAAGIHYRRQRLHRPRPGPALSQSRRRGLRHGFRGRSCLERRCRRRASTGDLAQSARGCRSRHSHGRRGVDGRPDAGGLGRQLPWNPTPAHGLPRTGCRAVRPPVICSCLRLRVPGTTSTSRTRSSRTATHTSIPRSRASTPCSRPMPAARLIAPSSGRAMSTAPHPARG